MRKRFIAMAACLMLLTGCGQSAQRNDELPEDTPWNNGVNAVMETDMGWYTNMSRTNLLNLHYIDKDSGVDVFLCSRPECMHEGGSSCTATYNGLETVNTVMYNGDIYFAAYEQDEETAGIALYRVTADGSSIDKVSDVYKIKFPRDDECKIGNEPFIIHKGYAYIPFDISKSSLPGFGGYIDSGLMKVNIYTGECSEIVSDEEGYFSPRARRLMGCGDFVYYDWSGTWQYDTVTGGCSPVGIKSEDKYTYIIGVTDKNFFISTLNEKDCLKIETYDKETLEFAYVAADTEGADHWPRILFYNDMIFICGYFEIGVYKDGERIGGISYEMGENEYKKDEDYFDGHYKRDGDEFIGQWNEFKISGEHLYLIESNFLNYNYETRVLCNVYRCPLEDIISGEGEFEEVFRVTDNRSAEALWAEHFAAIKKGG
ncbi:MAG: hypothetical protein K2N72_06760 [Oscillospiraceae bacterium]|nr:hypothetical protein [Oscillospiraceae bacterium]